MNQSQAGTGRQGFPLLLVDERAGMRGTAGQRESGSGRGRVWASWEDLQRLALQGRKARGRHALTLTQAMRKGPMVSRTRRREARDRHRWRAGDVGEW
jgi:hypothetical protein